MIDVNQFEKEIKNGMQNAVEYLEGTLARIRAGKANVRILDGIVVPYYGNNAPLSNVATITVPDAKTIIISPWEKNMLKVIEKAIMDSDVGITPENNGEIIRLGIPPLTEERRKQLVKQVKEEVEDAKISIRNARRDANDVIKKEIKDGMAEDLGKATQEEIQKIHDNFISKIDKIFAEKEEEIMKV